MAPDAHSLLRDPATTRCTSQTTTPSPGPRARQAAQEGVQPPTRLPTGSTATTATRIAAATAIPTSATAACAPLHARPRSTTPRHATLPGAQSLAASATLGPRRPRAEGSPLPPARAQCPSGSGPASRRPRKSRVLLGMIIVTGTTMLRERRSASPAIRRGPCHHFWPAAGSPPPAGADPAETGRGPRAAKPSGRCWPGARCRRSDTGLPACRRAPGPSPSRGRPGRSGRACGRTCRAGSGRVEEDRDGDAALREDRRQGDAMSVVLPAWATMRSPRYVVWAQPRPYRSSPMPLWCVPGDIAATVAALATRPTFFAGRVPPGPRGSARMSSALGAHEAGRREGRRGRSGRWVSARPNHRRCASPSPSATEVAGWADAGRHPQPASHTCAWRIRLVRPALDRPRPRAPA